MLLGGFQKLTLIDYPGHLATTVFTVGCSFRCPFCHNPELVAGTAFELSAGAGRDLSLQKKKEKEFLAYLRKRKGKLTGVCITGGEPTIQPDIIPFIKKIKKIGYDVKLDSNGTRPDVLKKVIDGKLVDYIAMDIKNRLSKYDTTTGTKVDKERIRLSIRLIMNSRIPYEFRTTVVPGLHTEKDFLEIAKLIKGAPIYYLQKYRDGVILDEKLRKKSKGKSLDLEKIKAMIEPYFKEVVVR